MATTLTTFDQPRDRRSLATLRNVRNRLQHTSRICDIDGSLWPRKERDSRIVRNSIRADRFVFEAEEDGGEA